jgi:cytochrome c
VRFVLAAVGVAVAAAAVSVGSSFSVVSADEAANTPAFYTQKVRPILMENCGKCHFNMNHKGGLAMDTKASFMKGGRDGVVIVPGDPANSVLLKLVKHEGPPEDPKPMPPKSPKLSDADIAVIEQWIKAGAVMPNDAAQQ